MYAEYKVADTTLRIIVKDEDFGIIIIIADMNVSNRAGLQFKGKLPRLIRIG